MNNKLLSLLCSAIRLIHDDINDLNGPIQTIMDIK